MTLSEATALIRRENEHYRSRTARSDSEGEIEKDMGNIQTRSVMRRFLAASGWNAGGLQHKQLEDALAGAHLDIVDLSVAIDTRFVLEQLVESIEIEVNVSQLSPVFRRRLKSARDLIAGWE